MAIVRNQHQRIEGIVPLHAARYPLAFILGKHTQLNLFLNSMAVLGGVPMLPDDRVTYDLVFQKLWSAFPECDSVYLKSIPKGSFCWSYLCERHWHGEGVTLYRPDGVRLFHSIELPATFSEYLSRFHGKTRWTLRKKVARLREYGGGQLKLVRVESAEQVPEFIASLRSVFDHSWQCRNACIRQYVNGCSCDKIADLARRGILRSYQLQCGDRCCAYVIGYSYAGVYHYSDVAYDKGYASFSPGTVLLYLLIEDLISHGATHWVNLGIGDGSYKRQFANRHVCDADFLLIRNRMLPRLRQGTHSMFRSAKSCLSTVLRRFRNSKHEKK